MTKNPRIVDVPMTIPIKLTKAELDKESRILLQRTQERVELEKERDSTLDGLKDELKIKDTTVLEVLKGSGAAAGKRLAHLLAERRELELSLDGVKTDYNGRIKIMVGQEERAKNHVLTGHRYEETLCEKILDYDTRQVTFRVKATQEAIPSRARAMDPEEGQTHLEQVGA